MKRGEAPGRTPAKGPDLVRTVAGLVLISSTIIFTLASAPPRRRPLAGLSAPGAPVAPEPSAAGARLALGEPASPPGPTGPQALSFETLGGFSGRDIPRSILALDGQVVRIEGNVLPVKMKGQKLAAFMLTAFVPDCCFGQEPRVNDWVMVGVPPDLNLPAKDLDYAVVTGRLTVKPVKDSTGELIGLFALHATTVTPAEGPTAAR